MSKYANLIEAAIDEALRKVGQHENGNRKATVHKDNEWGEYRVKHHIDGKHQTEADYHTDDKEEAMNHAHSWTHKTGVHANESIDHLIEMSKEKIQAYKIAAKADKFDNVAAAKKGDKEAADKADKRQDGIDKANKRLSTEATEGSHSPVKRKFTVHAKDKDGKDYKYDKEQYSPRSIHNDARFHELGHKLVKITHGDKDVTNEQVEQLSALDEREEGRTELHANHDLDPQNNHHVYVMSRGKKKSIAGPFKSKDEAEKHPARKFGDGVATSDQISH